MQYTQDELAMIEKAITVVSERLSGQADLPKPVLLHSIRVGTWLYNHGYPANTVVAGYLHDIIEDTETSETELATLFNAEVATLVAANSKDSTIADREQRRKELITRCVQAGEQAAIVKAADILDNFQFYTAQKDPLVAYCKANAKDMNEVLPKTYGDLVFKSVFELISPRVPN